MIPWGVQHFIQALHGTHQNAGLAVVVLCLSLLIVLLLMRGTIHPFSSCVTYLHVVYPVCPLSCMVRHECLEKSVLGLFSTRTQIHVMDAGFTEFSTTSELGIASIYGPKSPRFSTQVITKHTGSVAFPFAH